MSTLAERQYIDLCNRILSEGHWVKNDRTGKRCLTVINADMEYTVEDFPLSTLRKSYWEPAIAEIIGYLRGFDNAQYFSDLGANTWFNNANKSKAWLSNPNRKGENDMGRVYGVQLRGWENFKGERFDQLAKVLDHLTNAIDDRGEILSMWNPGEHHLGCLRPCLYSYQFSILNNELFLNATQRSCDVPLGLNFNQVQVWFMLYWVSALTGLKPGKAYHKIVNAHIYEDQIIGVREMLKNKPSEIRPRFIRKNKNLNPIDTMTPKDFFVADYPDNLPVIKFPFSE
jgi:thymidylate synthase